MEKRERNRKQIESEQGEREMSGLFAPNDKPEQVEQAEKVRFHVKTSHNKLHQVQNKSHTPREGLCAPHSLLCFLIGKSYIEVVNRPQKLTNCAAIHYNELGFALHSFYMQTLLVRHRFGCFFTLCTNNPFWFGVKRDIVTWSFLGIIGWNGWISCSNEPSIQNMECTYCLPVCRNIAS